jgi:hypothetical protein
MNESNYHHQSAIILSTAFQIKVKPKYELLLYPMFSIFYFIFDDDIPKNLDKLNMYSSTWFIRC